VDVYAHGIVMIVNGSGAVSFDHRFVEAISSDVPVTLALTPIGPFQVFVDLVGHEGAQIAELNGRHTFKAMWIAIGRRAGYENSPILPNLLADPSWNDKLLRVMHNENAPGNALPMWWDGSSYRFDAIPQVDNSAEKAAELARLREMQPAESPAVESKPAPQVTSTVKNGTR
jgi:hypothetical protein